MFSLVWWQQQWGGGGGGEGGRAALVFKLIQIYDLGTLVELGVADTALFKKMNIFIE